MKSFHWLLLFLSFFLIGVIIYSPSLGGPFQYDDYAQILDNKVLTGRPLPKLLSSIFRFTAHPDGWTGTRDFVRATFLLNWQWWGERPLGYRWVNLAIHVINAWLVSILAWQLFRNTQNTQGTGKSDKSDNQRIGKSGSLALRFSDTSGSPSFPSVLIHWISIGAGLLFLVHPLNSQAVAYVAQRFTSVATLFYLLTIILFGRTLNFSSSENSAGTPEPRSRDATTRGRRPREWRAYCWGAAALLSALLAYNSKEIAITLPVALTLVALYNNYKSYKIYLLLIPFFLLALKIPLQTATASAAGASAEAAAAPSPLKLDFGAFALRQKEDLLSRRDYFLTQISVVATYLRLAVLPVNQTLDYDYPITRNPDARTLALAALHLGLIGIGGWLLLKKSTKSIKSTTSTKGIISAPQARQASGTSGTFGTSIIGFGLLWFYLTLLPESSLIPIPDVIYEHRAYLPLVGVCLAFAGLLRFIPEHSEYSENQKFRKSESQKIRLSDSPVFRPSGSLSFPSVPKTYLWWGIAVWLVILSFGTTRRAWVWGNEVRLWADVYAKAPNKPRAVKNYGVVLAASGKYDDGIRLLETAVKLDADNADYWSNLGTANLRAGRYDAAKDKFLTAYELLAAEVGLPDSIPDLDPKTRKQAAQYLNDYGVCLVQLGRGEEALAAFQKSLAIDPTLYAARLGLGAAYNILGDIQNAIDVFEAAVEEFPEQPDAYNNLAVMYKKAGRLADHDRILKAAPKAAKTP